jgi:hypothetical protein
MASLRPGFFIARPLLALAQRLKTSGRLMPPKNFTFRAPEDLHHTAFDGLPNRLGLARRSGR